MPCRELTYYAPLSSSTAQSLGLPSTVHLTGRPTPTQSVQTQRQSTVCVQGVLRDQLLVNLEMLDQGRRRQRQPGQATEEGEDAVKAVDVRAQDVGRSRDHRRPP